MPIRDFAWNEKHSDYLIVGIGLILALVLRYSLVPFESVDFHSFLGPWYDFIVQNGGFSALRHDFANYTPPYLYLLALDTYLFSGLPKILAIKLNSILFDFLCAFFVFKLVRLKYPAGIVPLLAALVMLFAPTVVLNSAFWGQADIIYVTGLVACLYFLAVKRETMAFVAFGLAFAFKLQALFFAPVLLFLLLRGRVHWKSFFVIPLVYLLAMLPAWLVGRSLPELLLIYLTQADYYQSLSMNAPNLYQWIPNEHYDIFYPAGLIWTAAAVFLVAVPVMKSRTSFSRDLLILLATVSVVMVPYLLPKMHDRYFFAADVISIVFAFYFPRYFFIPVTIGMVSLFSYFPFLFGQVVISLALLAIVLLVVIVILLRRLILDLNLSASSQTTQVVKARNGALLSRPGRDSGSNGDAHGEPQPAARERAGGSPL